MPPGSLRLSQSLRDQREINAEDLNRLMEEAREEVRNFPKVWNSKRYLERDKGGDENLRNE